MSVQDFYFYARYLCRGFPLSENASPFTLIPVMSELENIMLSLLTFCLKTRKMNEGTWDASYGGESIVLLRIGYLGTPENIEIIVGENP